MLAYVDTSCLVAVAFTEAGAARLAGRLRRFERLFSSNLLEAELRSALIRERVSEAPDELLSWITWVYPNRPVTPEFERIVEAGYLNRNGAGALPRETNRAAWRRMARHVPVSSSAWLGTVRV